MLVKAHSSPNILVFDSGAGGLTIAKELLKRLPHCQLSFVADTAYFPYGLKNDTDLTHRIIAQVERYHKQIEPDLVVVACNTASTLALDTLRSEFSCPFVGVVPAIKPAAQLSKSGTIGVLATPATVSRDYTRKLINDFASQHRVILHGSDKLVQLAEQKINQKNIDKAVLSEELSALFRQTHGDQIDTIVLACTHFPILKDEMKDIVNQWGKSITWVDSGNAVAKRVQHLLPSKCQGKSEQKHQIKVFLTAENYSTRTSTARTKTEYTATESIMAVCYKKYLGGI